MFRNYSVCLESIGYHNEWGLPSFFVFSYSTTTILYHQSFLPFSIAHYFLLPQSFCFLYLFLPQPSIIFLYLRPFIPNLSEIFLLSSPSALGHYHPALGHALQLLCYYISHRKFITISLIPPFAPGYYHPALGHYHLAVTPLLATTDLSSYHSLWNNGYAHPTIACTKSDGYHACHELGHFRRRIIKLNWSGQFTW